MTFMVNVSPLTKIKFEIAHGVSVTYKKKMMEALSKFRTCEPIFAEIPGLLFTDHWTVTFNILVL